MKLTKENLTMALFTKDRYEPLQKCINSFTSTAPEGTQVMVIEDQPKNRFRNSGLIPEYEHLHVVEMPKKSSCAHLFNLCLLLTETRFVLVTQDDIIFNSDKWLKIAEEKLEEGYECILMHNWSAYIIDKKCLPRFGYADERFKGGAWEDADLSLRARLPGKIKLCNVTGPLENKSSLEESQVSGADIRHDNQHREHYTKASWDASYNEKYFAKKWRLGSFDRLIKLPPTEPDIEDIDWYPALTDLWRE